MCQKRECGRQMRDRIVDWANCTLALQLPLLVHLLNAYLKLLLKLSCSVGLIMVILVWEWFMTNETINLTLMLECTCRAMPYPEQECQAHKLVYFASQTNWLVVSVSIIRPMLSTHPLIYLKFWVLRHAWMIGPLPTQLSFIALAIIKIQELHDSCHYAKGKRRSKNFYEVQLDLIFCWSRSSMCCWRSWGCIVVSIASKLTHRMMACLKPWRAPTNWTVNCVLLW